jgi:hypothetical protein
MELRKFIATTIREYLNENVNTYNDIDRETIRAYTMSRYIDFGDYFRFNNTKNNDVIKLIPLMDNVLSKKSFKTKIILYRGFGSISDLFSTKKREIYKKPQYVQNLSEFVGKTFFEKSYLSTTYSLDVAKYWSGRKEDQGGYLVMNISYGINYVNRQEILDDNSNEKEIILQRNLMMTITNIDYDNDNFLRVFVDVDKK